MLKLSKLAFSLSACLAITACGGGGSSGGENPPADPTTSLGVTVNTGNETLDNDMVVCLDVSGNGDCSCEKGVPGLSITGADGMLEWDDAKISQCQGVSTASSSAALYNAKVIAFDSKSNIFLSYSLDNIKKIDANKYEKLYLNPLSVLQDALGSADEVATSVGLPSQDQKADYAKVPFSSYSEKTKVTAELFVDAGVMEQNVLRNKSAVEKKVHGSYASVEKALDNQWDKNDISGWLSQDNGANSPFDKVDEIGSQPKDIINKAPSTKFTYVLKNKYVVEFVNASTDPEDDPMTYSWNFGDGSSLSSEESPKHVFSDKTKRSVTLRACDDKNACAPYTLEVEPLNCVENCEQNSKPVASFDAAVSNGTVTFTNNSKDPDGDAMTFTWDFGDSTTLDKKSKEEFTHTYTRTGSYSVKLIANDGTVDSEPFSKIINIDCINNCGPINHPPVAKFTAVNSGKGKVIFTNQSTDEDNDTLKSTWAMGNGEVVGNNNTTFAYTYQSAGSYDVKLTVTDGKGGTATSSVTVNPCFTDCIENDNVAPVAKFSYKISTSGVVFTNESSDADGDALTTTWIFDNETPVVMNDKTFTKDLSAGLHKVTIQVTDGKVEKPSVSELTIDVPNGLRCTLN